MPNADLHKVIYKPDSQSTEEYIIFVYPEEFHKYKDGDTTIPLSQVVDSFDVFHSGQGHQGKLGKASKQQLETVFGTSREDDVLKQMVENGTLQAGSGIKGQGFDKSGHGSTLDTRGSGGGLRGI